MLKISVQEFHKDLILPVSQGVCFGARNEDGKVCIGYMSIRQYMTKNINQ